jgi:hypothetical protein
MKNQHQRYAEGLAVLRRAVGLAVAYLETGSAAVLAARRAVPLQVAQVRLVVRQMALHHALAPLLADGEGKAQHMLATMLLAQGLAQADGFHVDYRFQPWAAGAGGAGDDGEGGGEGGSGVGMAACAPGADMQVVLHMADCRFFPE